MQAIPIVPAIEVGGEVAAPLVGEALNAAKGPVVSAAERVAQLAEGALTQIQRERYVTLAVTETEEGVRVISSSEGALRQKAIDMLQAGEVAVTRKGDAEVIGVEGARALGLTPTGVAASRPIGYVCQIYTHYQGVPPLTPIKP
jgi:hypothetical protein